MKISAKTNRVRKALPKGSRRQSKGIGLIEVMIAVLIMGVGMLGVAAMQVTALRNNQSALERTQATIQTYSIMDAMRANRDAALAGAYNIGPTCDAPGGASLAQVDVSRWIDSLETTLGDSAGTCGTIACDLANCVVTVQWDDSRATEGRTVSEGQTIETAGDDTRQVITRARL